MKLNTYNLIKRHDLIDMVLDELAEIGVEDADRATKISFEDGKKLKAILEKKYSIEINHEYYHRVVDDFVASFIDGMILVKIYTIAEKFNIRRYDVCEELFAGFDPRLKELRLMQLHTGLNNGFWLDYYASKDKFSKAKTFGDYVKIISFFIIK